MRKASATVVDLEDHYNLTYELKPKTFYDSHCLGINSVDVKPDGNLVVTSGRDRTLRSWFWPEVFLPNRRMGHLNRVQFMKVTMTGSTKGLISPNDRVGSFSGISLSAVPMTLWLVFGIFQLNQNAFRARWPCFEVFASDLQGHLDYVWRVAGCGDHVASISFDGLTLLWDMETGSVVNEFLGSHHH